MHPVFTRVLTFDGRCGWLDTDRNFFNPSHAPVSFFLWTCAYKISFFAPCNTLFFGSLVVSAVVCKITSPPLPSKVNWAILTYRKWCYCHEGDVTQLDSSRVTVVWQPLAQPGSVHRCGSSTTLTQEYASCLKLNRCVIDWLARP